eukprot:6208057-Lingulodinium_polyedra.AAC.1
MRGQCAGRIWETFGQRSGVARAMRGRCAGDLRASPALCAGDVWARRFVGAVGPIVLCNHRSREEGACSW